MVVRIQNNRLGTKKNPGAGWYNIATGPLYLQLQREHLTGFPDPIYYNTSSMGGLGPRLGGESDPPSTPSAGKRARLPGRRWPISLDLAGGSSGRGPRIEAGSRTRDNSSRPSTAIHSSTHPSHPIPSFALLLLLLLLLLLILVRPDMAFSLCLLSLCASWRPFCLFSLPHTSLRLTRSSPGASGD